VALLMDSSLEKNRPPSNVTTTQLVDVSVRYIRNHPEIRHTALNALLLKVFNEAWPREARRDVVPPTAPSAGPPTTPAAPSTTPAAPPTTPGAAAPTTPAPPVQTGAKGQGDEEATERRAREKTAERERKQKEAEPRQPQLIRDIRVFDIRLDNVLDRPEDPDCSDCRAKNS
jgi:hypothetical protein